MFKAADSRASLATLLAIGVVISPLIARLLPPGEAVRDG
jgi:hypothetical protein